ncbi:MAG: caspase family protein [Candidatus Kapabacteria bacterium]|nr:caspase family protein [Candidatus Kapabacteria bacterium]
MKRAALIVYCDNTQSGQLPGPCKDYINFRNYLLSNLGGNWYENEVNSLRNPTFQELKDCVVNCMSNKDYTFIVFSGHGYIQQVRGLDIQYLELKDANVSINDLISNAKRQTIVIDACRGRIDNNYEVTQKGLDDVIELAESNYNTRFKFDTNIMKADEGVTVLYSADINQTSLDTKIGGAYIFSLIDSVKSFNKQKILNSITTVQEAHYLAKAYIKIFPTVQNPVMSNEKRLIHFPFAVR